MVRKLLIIFGVGLVLAMAGLAGSAAVGGSEDWPEKYLVFGKGSSDEGESDGKQSSPGPVATREAAWNGDEALVINFPADVTYIQSDEPGVTITGPKNRIELVKLEDGKITGPVTRKKTFTSFSTQIGVKGSKTVWRDRQDDGIKITVKAPNVRRFTLDGVAALVISGYKQDDLEINSKGASQITASGEATRLDLEMDGPGKGEFSDLVLQEAKIRLNGASKVTAAPTRRADIEVSGVGNVRLRHRPAELKQTVNGVGSVDIDDASAPEPKTPASKASRNASAT